MLSVFITGIALGALYAMTALVYNVMFSTSKVLSFGAGQFAMLGGIVGAWTILNLKLPVWIALAAVILIGAAFGWVSEFVAVRRVMRNADAHLWVLSTLALATLMQQAMGLIWGTEPTPFPRVIEQVPGTVADQKFWLPILLAGAMAVGLEIFYRRTMLGKAFVAMSEDEFAARARGIATDHLRSLSYMFAGILGALSGFAAGQLTFADVNLGDVLGLGGFIALAVGGIGSNMGSLIGGLVVGILASLTDHFVGAQYQRTIGIGLLILVLIVRPQGLFGSSKLRQV